MPLERMTTLALLGLVLAGTDAFMAPSYRVHGRERTVSFGLSDEDGIGSIGNFDFDDASFMKSLRARVEELESRENMLEEKWKKAKCVSSTTAVLPDWVRRMDVGDFPYAACGSASGNIFVINLEEANLIARTEKQEEQKSLDNLGPILQSLYSGYDGGGTIAIAMRKDLICSAGRQGSVQVWVFDEMRKRLVSQGSMLAIKGKLVTCLELDDRYLWVATAEGDVMAFSYVSETLPLTLQREPELEWSFDSPILSLSISLDLGYGVATTENKTAELFSLYNDQEAVVTWKPQSASLHSVENAHLLSAALVPLKGTDGGCVVVGGTTDGSLLMQSLNWNRRTINTEEPFLEEITIGLLPKHNGPLKCLASPSPGLLISAGQDGTMKIWSLAEDNKENLYQFVGYKVWLGSLWTDGSRIVTDGSDNTLIMHDFSKTKGQSL